MSGEQTAGAKAVAKDLAMFINELHSMLVHLGRLVVNDGRMLMCPDASPATQGSHWAELT